MKKDVAKVLELLKASTRSKPINSGLISRLSGMNSEAIRETVNGFRRDGLPVCSSRNGYWMAHDPSEIDETVQNLSSRIAGMEAAIRGLMTARANMVGIDLSKIIDEI